MCATQTTAVSQPLISGRAALVRLLVLLVLVALVFQFELRMAWGTIRDSGEWSHALVLPLLVVLLAWQRRHDLAAALDQGSAWGPVIIVLGLTVVALNLWPLEFGYLRAIALVPVCVGVLLTTCGRRMVRPCLPMFLLLALSIPLGPRQYAALIIRAETYTLAAGRAVLSALPDVDVTQSGPDLDFVRGSQSGTVAPGEPRRGASLLVTYAVLGVCVVCARHRPRWQVVLLALAAVPIVLLSNLGRFVLLGLFAVYAHASPLSAWPRAAAAVLSLVLAYLLFAAAIGLLNLFVLQPAAGEPVAAEEG